MITIALDEGEHFERPRNCMFVGGVIFEHKTYNDMERERLRLQKYLKNTCLGLNCDYPEDLHYNWDKGRVINVDQAQKVKTALENTLADFMQGKGIWRKDPPQGNYRLFALIGDKRGIQSFCKPGISNLIDDTVACNRYEHMAYRTVENLLFYNPYQSDENVKLELATRVINPEPESQLAFDVKTLGLSKSDPKSGDNRYQVTDAGSFRAAIASSIQDSEKQNIQFTINVQSINYKKEAVNSRIDLYQSFLYLADTVCSIFSSHVHGIYNCYEALEVLDKTSRAISGMRNYIWAYEEIDQTYRKVYKGISNGNYFDALSALFDGLKNNPQYGCFYDQLWFSPLRKMIINNGNAFSIKKAIEKLETYLYSPNYDIDKAEYIYNSLEAATTCSCDDSKDDLFYLYKVEMIINNHKGDYDAAEITVKNCLKYSSYVPIEEYLEVRNMISVYLLDRGDFAQALTFSKDTVAYEEMLVDIRKEIFPQNEDIFLHLGRSLSQLAQCFSFIHDFENGEKCFLKALGLFGNDRTDYQITLSYYLHLLIEKGDIESYEKYASVYFGSADIKNQYRNILKLERTTNRYAFYVYIKSLFCLYKSSISKSFIKEVVNGITRQYEKSHGGHPWELILKYCAFLTIEFSLTDYPHKDLMMKAEKSVEPAVGRIGMIIESSKREYVRLLNGNDPFTIEEDAFMYH